MKKNIKKIRNSEYYVRNTNVVDDIFVEFKKEEDGTLYGKYSETDEWLLYPDKFIGINLRSIGDKIMVDKSYKDLLNE